MNLLASPPTVIFVRPQAFGNIGALARTMSNFGCTTLRLTGQNPLEGRDSSDPYLTMDWALAKRGESILKQAVWFTDLKAALHDCHLVIGSSGRAVEFERGYARPICTPQEGLASALQAVKTASEVKQTFKWAFVLGPEDDGLADHEAALCQKLIKIPTADLNPSLNIAMAAGVVFYHWYLLASGGLPLPTANENSADAADSGPFLPLERRERLGSSEPGRADWATFEQKEKFLNYLMVLVSQTKFLKYPDKESVESRIRRWLQIGQIPAGELLFAFEILYHLKCWGTGQFESRDFLKS